jgi:glutamate racemase
VLGCTHYPFLTPIIEQAAGPGVAIIDPAVAVARELRRRLEASGLLAPDGRLGTEVFWTTGQPDQVAKVIVELWPGDVHVHAVPATSPA